MFQQGSYTVLGESQTDYALDSQHDITTPSNRAVYVYLNECTLILGTDYTFSTTDDSVTYQLHLQKVTSCNQEITQTQQAVTCHHLRLNLECIQNSNQSLYRHDLLD